MNKLAINNGSIDIMNLGQVLSQSGYFQDARDAAQAVVKVLAGQELGFGPVASMTGINIIKGKVSLSANLMAAAIKQSGRYTFRLTKGHPTESECSIEFFERSGDKWDSLGVSTFTIDDAKQAGLGGDNWRKYPRNMLYARAMSNGVKWYCPDISGSPLYTPDELGADIDGETGEVVGYGPDMPIVESDDIGHPAEVINLETDERTETKSFTKYDDFLHALNEGFKLNEDQAKDKLKALGFTGFTAERSGEMYAAIKRTMAEPAAA